MLQTTDLKELSNLHWSYLRFTAWSYYAIDFYKRSNKHNQMEIKFAGNTTVFQTYDPKHDAAEYISDSLSIVDNWFTDNKLCMNTGRIQKINITLRPQSQLITALNCSKEVSFVGKTLDKNWSWEHHILQLS